MRPLATPAVLLALLFALLSACGKSSESEFIQTSPTTYSVSAEEGPTFGGFDRAKDEATAKATKFCERGGQQVALRDEQRSGSSVLGAPQKSTITFACVSDATSTGAAPAAAPVPPTLNAKRMAAIKKCTDGLKFDSNRYAACMSKEGESP
jgi:hypothetical protein